MKQWRRPWLVLPVGIGLVLGLGRGALAAFSATTADGVNQFVTAPDWEPPHVTRTVIAKTVGYLAGKIHQGGQFYVYAQIDDGGNPPAGVGTVTADVSAFSSGGGAVAMNAGAFSARGVPYNYRSASRTAINPMANGTRTYSFTMADVAVPVHSQTETGFAVTIDNTVPAPMNMTSANGAGGTVGRAEQGDSVTYTWSEPIDPESLLSGWDGGSPTTVTVRIKNKGPNDRLSIEGPAGTLNFGLVALQQNYFPGDAGVYGLGHHDDRKRRHDRARDPEWCCQHGHSSHADHMARRQRGIRRLRQPVLDSNDHRLGLAPDRLLGRRWTRARTFGHYPVGGINLYRTMCRKLGCGRLGSGSRIVGSPPPR